MFLPVIPESPAEPSPLSALPGPAPPHLHGPGEVSGGLAAQVHRPRPAAARLYQGARDRQGLSHLHGDPEPVLASVSQQCGNTLY